VDLGDEDLFLVGRGLRDEDSLRIHDEGASPELDARPSARRHFMPDAVDRSNVQTVGDRMSPLHGDPGLLLSWPVFGLLVRMPADGRGIEEDRGSRERRDPRPLRIPLIPADESPDLSLPGLERREAQISRREVELLVVGGVVGDVHLAIEPEDLPVRVDDGCAVVVEAGGPPLEDRSNNTYIVIPGGAAESLSRGPRNGLGQIEYGDVLALAEILRSEELGQADDAGPLRRRLLHTG